MREILRFELDVAKKVVAASQEEKELKIFETSKATESIYEIAMARIEDYIFAKFGLTKEVELTPLLNQEEYERDPEIKQLCDNYIDVITPIIPNNSLLSSSFLSAGRNSRTWGSAVFSKNQ